VAGDGIRLGGAYYELVADDSKLIQTLARSQSQAKTFSDGIARSMGTAATSTDTAMKKMAASTQQASTGFAGMAKGAASFGIAAAGIAGAAVTVNNAIGSIAESTKAAQQAQFALSKTYGTSAPEMAAFAKQFGDQIGRSTTEVMQSAVVVGNLTKEYGLNQAQARQLIRISADLAAVYGKDLPDAVQRLQAAIRGEAESAEALGLVLNDDAVATRTLGAANKELWEHLTDAEKAQLRLIEATRQLAERQGAAEERAAGLMGNFDRLNKAADELGAALGERLLPPAAAVAGALALMANNAIDALRAFDNLANMDLARLNQLAAILALIINPVGGVSALISSGAAGSASANAAAAGEAAALKAAADKAEADAKAAKTAADIAAKAAARKALDDADKANKAAAKSAIDAIEAEKRAKEQWYDEEKQRIEARRTYQLEDIETRKRAALDALAAEKQATLDAIDDQIEQQERLKQVRLDAAEAAADAAKAALAAQKQRLEIERELEDRQRADQREAEDRSLEDARRREDRSREQRQKDEIQGLKELTEARQEAVEAGIAALEKATEQRIRALDRESDRARANGERALARLERQGEKEDELHRKRMQALEDEQDARLDILDAQLKALDAQERSTDLSRRTADLQKRIVSAQQAQTAARGTGTPEEIAEAREELTRAFRAGNEISITNARQRLAQLAGQGTEAIKKADEDLASAQQELRDEGIDQARDAEREKLNAAKAAITDEIDARQRAEDDADRGRKQDLERHQEAERGKTKATLDRIDKQKQAERDSGENSKAKLRADLEAVQQAADEEVRITRARHEQEDQLAEDSRREQDRVRKDAREAEDRLSSDARRAQDADLARQLAAVSSTLEAERRATEEHYNGPNGIVTQLKAARDASEREYSARQTAVTRAYEAERKAAEDVYHNADGTGALDLLQKQRAAEIQALVDRKTEYEEQYKAFHQMILDMLADIDAFIAKQQTIPRIGGDSPAQSSPGTGNLTSTSTTSTRSSASGKQVQGDLVTWLSDAMNITGVGNDWLSSLKWILDHESSGGDPHAKNPNSTASGMFQLIDSTWAAYRDKKLPNNVFDPVANSVAAIRYIKDRYGSPSKAVEFWKKNNYYDAGGLIREPVMGMGLRSGRPYSIAEYGPEYVLGRRATSMLGAGPGRGSAGMSGFMSSAHPGGGGIGGGDVNNWSISGIGLGEVASEIVRRQHRARILRGSRGRA
jgi:hypothetical protein